MPTPDGQGFSLSAPAAGPGLTGAARPRPAFDLGVRTLPLRIAPMAGEPFDSWLEANARRMGITGAGMLTALGIRGPAGLPADHTVFLRAHEAVSVSAVSGVPVARLHVMTMRLFDGHAVVLRSQRRSLVRSAWWTRKVGSRYCPGCLQARTGRWLLSWRLNWAFACVRHQVLLLDACPGCRQIPRTRLAATAGIRPASACTTCGADLSEAPTVTAGQAVLAAQHRIDQVLHRLERPVDNPVDGDTPIGASDGFTGPTGGIGTAGAGGSPSAVFTDLTAVSAWLLRRCTPSDIERFGDQAVAGWHANAGREDWRRPAPGRPLLIPPVEAALVAAMASWATELIADPDREAAIEKIRVLLRRGPKGRRMPPDGMGQQWNKLSASTRGRLLQGMDPDLGPVDRIRYRSLIPAARSADPAGTAHRARWLPQLLWPEWTIRLMPAQGFGTDAFRGAVIDAVLLAGHPRRNVTQVARHLHPYRTFRISTTLGALIDAGHDSVLAAICLLADHLDEHGAVIDYHRRRDLITSPVIDAHQWRDLSLEAGAHPGENRRLLSAQRHLHVLLTGNDLNDPRNPLTYRNPGQRAIQQTFDETLTTALRRALRHHAAAHLAALGIAEPVASEPPARILRALTLPGRDPDDIDWLGLYRLIIDQQQTVGAAAVALGRTIDHVRLAVERLLHPARIWGDNALPNVTKRLSAARDLLTREFFEREYLGNDRRIRQITEATGIPKRMVKQIAWEVGIQLLPSHPKANLIDEAWLREQYLERKRSFVQIAADLGLTDETVSRAARSYGIPVRPAGIASHTQMIRTLPDIVPADIRAAVEGGLAGWQRLQRFAAVMKYPTINQAAKDLGFHPTALVTQFQRLERDIGAALFVRATPAKPMRPTERGIAVIAALASPDIQALAPAAEATPLGAVASKTPPDASALTFRAKKSSH